MVSVASTSCIEAKDCMLLTEYMKHYKGVCENATDVVTDTSDDLFFLNGKCITLLNPFECNYSLQCVSTTILRGQRILKMPKC